MLEGHECILTKKIGLNWDNRCSPTFKLLRKRPKWGGPLFGGSFIFNRIYAILGFSKTDVQGQRVNLSFLGGLA